jgi:hypothetical protein
MTVPWPHSDLERARITKTQTISVPASYHLPPGRSTTGGEDPSCRLIMIEVCWRRFSCSRAGRRLEHPRLFPSTSQSLNLDNTIPRGNFVADFGHADSQDSCMQLRLQFLHYNFHREVEMALKFSDPSFAHQEISFG